MTLGITDNGRPGLERYTEWVARLAPDVQWAKLSHTRENAKELERCDGLILTGGGDIHPQFYGREDAHDLVRGVDVQRDEFEFDIVRSALTMQLPILGICRGMQVFNVASGGTMIPDVLHAGFQDHGKKGDGSDGLHTVHVERGTLLGAVVGVEEGEVNSSHHQAVDRIGRGLRVVARSTDGLAEAMEWESTAGKPFVLLVQWHPERMKHRASPFCDVILAKFVHEVRRAGTGNEVLSSPTTRNT